MTYQRLTKIDIENVFSFMRTNKGRMHIKGVSVKVRHLRMRVFEHHGVKCAHCGEQGSFFAVEKIKKNPHLGGWHLNLYSASNIMLTFDHVIAKSKGGPNTLDNAQTLCRPCNQRKADS